MKIESLKLPMKKYSHIENTILENLCTNFEENLGAIFIIQNMFDFFGAFCWISAKSENYLALWHGQAKMYLLQKIL